MDFQNAMLVASEALARIVRYPLFRTRYENPAYSLVANRVNVPLVDLETLIKPSFVYLKSNDNPALEAFSEFIAALD